MTRRAVITFACLAIVGCAAAPAIVGGDNVIHRDAIVYHAEQGKKLVDRQQTEITDARADARKWEQSATAWESEYNSLYNSVPYWIGWLIWVAFKWWLLALIATFIARMIFAYVGGPIGAVGAMLTTHALGILTCFLSYVTNIPDNLYFKGRIQQLEAELRTAQLAAAAATGATAVATGSPAAVATTVGEDPAASMSITADAGGAK